MIIHPLSDLHNELYRHAEPSVAIPDIPGTDADLIVLAGDIDTGDRGVQWAVEQSEKHDKPVLYVPGNHEYYRHDIQDNLAAMRKRAEGTRVQVLDQDQAVIGGVRFLGCTLWTDYLAYDGESRDEPMAIAAQRMPDHQLITIEGVPFLPEHALALHQAAIEWLDRRIAEPFDGPTVVISHHGPAGACCHPVFSPGPLDGAFFSRLEDRIGRVDLWIHGHTHLSLDLPVGEGRLISNQSGYRGETSGFDWNKTVSVPA
ncbi:hypothetical protein A6D6_01617 [Alcanivorax xiamenensis]|uniref:Calcineurin-like phosphoesterase domain-containing protein n=1 Tax=Alcanivorax xiamenensis TaxID=1177156 RepID=A0ABQ6Y994_9GAMM|nr:MULTISPECIES: metallophosphoesterase [Alcanivorax]KAF0806282.1 hypothetical protein A6D6_01617 [Alcanivorax xiamenensis]